MSIFKNINFKKILLITTWVVLGAGALTLLIAAIKEKAAKTCTGLEIEIAGATNNFFIDKKDISDIILHVTKSPVKGQRINNLDLIAIENQLKKDVWVSKAELYFDKDGKLMVAVEEKEPIARIFSTLGNTFYIGANDNMLPLSNKHTARLPVFTNFPSELKVLSKKDSALLKDIRNISTYIIKDTFLMAMIDQVDIRSDRRFEMIPKVGEQTIVFGDANDMENKFEKIKLFYKKVIAKNGWSTYNTINVSYKDQIVATIKGAADVAADSLRTLQMMKALADYSSKMASDTSRSMVQDSDKANDLSMILSSIPREEPSDETNTTVAPPSPAVPTPAAKNSIPKSNTTTQKNTKQQPKSTQKKQKLSNDYK